MPKVEIDYSNTIIYKITCNNPNVTDSYVGHTTNFVQRKHAHKNGVTNEKSPCYSLKLYKTIRDNGGWDNWKMEMVQFYNCKNIYEAKIKEQEHFTELKASLNSIEPMKSKEKVIDTVTIQHQVSEENEVSKINYNCEKCDYGCYSQSLWRQHLTTKKHNKEDIESTKNVCACGASYETRSGLWKHEKRCSSPKPVTNIDYKELVNQLLADNRELRSFIIEQSKVTNDTMNKVIEQANKVIEQSSYTAKFYGGV
jgi:hypothetical protein